MAASRDASEMMVSMAALILKDENMDITPEHIQKLVDAAGGKIEPYWPKLFCQAIAGIDIDGLMTAVGSAPSAAPVAGGAAAATGGPAAAAPAAEEKKEEPEEEEDDDMGFSLFD